MQNNLQTTNKSRNCPLRDAKIILLDKNGKGLKILNPFIFIKHFFCLDWAPFLEKTLIFKMPVSWPLELTVETLNLQEPVNLNPAGPCMIYASFIL